MHKISLKVQSFTFVKYQFCDKFKLPKEIEIGDKKLNLYYNETN